MDEQQKSQQDRWQELAALLGLEPESPSQRTAARPAPPEPAAREPERFPAEPVHTEDRFEETQEGPTEELDSELPVETEAREGDEAPPGEDRGRRGRRRRGRRGGRKDDSRHKPYKPARYRDEPPEESNRQPEPAAEGDRAGALAEQAGPSESAEGELTDDRDREPLEVDEPMQPVPSDADENDDDDEEDAPMDWNVVTWSELIASLKRS